MPTIQGALSSSYDRKGIEKIISQKFGNTNLTDGLTKEIMYTSYDYISHEPRLFTKYAAKLDPENYDVTLAQAAAASAAAPNYFDPKEIGNQLLIDGGLIANDPSLFAYLHSVYMLKKIPEEIRIVSIGTGMKTPNKIDADKMSTLDWAGLLGTFLTTTDQYTHAYLLNQLGKDYHRFQANLTADIFLDAYSDGDIIVLKVAG